MNTSFREYMRPGIILHMAYDGLSTGTGPVLECLSHIAEDDYFDAVEITHIEDDETRKKSSRDDQSLAHGSSIRWTAVSADNGNEPESSGSGGTEKSSRQNEGCH